MKRPDGRLARSLRLWRLRVWGRPGAGPGTLPMQAVRVLLLTLSAFRRNHLSVHATGLTFYLLLSVVPFLAFVLLVLRTFELGDTLRPHLLSFVAGGNPELLPFMEQYVRNAQSGMVGGVGLAVTFGVGYLLLQRVKNTLNLVWEIRRPMYSRRRLIEHVAVLAVAPLLMAGAFSVTGFLGSSTVLNAVPAGVLRVLPTLPLANLAGFVIMVGLTFYAHRYLPDTLVDGLPALLGALLAGGGLVLMQKFYVVLMLVVARQSPIYGALALLPFLVLWFHLAWQIFLLGAQLGFVAQHYERELEMRRAGDSALAHQPYLALLVLTALMRQLNASGRSVHRRQLARSLRLPGDTVHDTLLVLTRAGLLTPVQGHSGRFVAQEALDRLTALDVLQRTDLLPAFPAVPLWHGHSTGSPILNLFHLANQGMAARLGSVTLRQLAERMGADARLRAAEPEASPRT